VIRQRLEELGLGQKDLADAAGVTDSYVSKLLTRVLLLAVWTQRVQAAVDENVLVRQRKPVSKDMVRVKTG
jgi:transcriptional regulator with XRE-family HTH domain